MYNISMMILFLNSNILCIKKEGVILDFPEPTHERILGFLGNNKL
jgi:hypothetical protein